MIESEAKVMWNVAKTCVTLECSLHQTILASTCPINKQLYSLKILFLRKWNPNFTGRASHSVTCFRQICPFHWVFIFELRVVVKKDKATKCETLKAKPRHQHPHLGFDCPSCYYGTSIWHRLIIKYYFSYSLEIV